MIDKTELGKRVQNEKAKQCVVLRNPQKLGISTLSRLMDDCLPENGEIFTEIGFQQMINNLWPRLCTEFEIEDV